MIIKKEDVYLDDQKKTALCVTTENVIFKNVL